MSHAGVFSKQCYVRYVIISFKINTASNILDLSDTVLNVYLSSQQSCEEAVRQPPFGNEDSGKEK